ncbi:ABC transporter substrate-binding protein [Rhodopila sp.]|uniref:ABC transporter substrate-binding protein n=1 Tax=Rhodopila sp. TaxID=2480087 RepID=UPI003D0FE823
MKHGKPTRRTLLSGASAALALGAEPLHAETPGDPIRPLVLISKPQANDPAQYQAAQLAMQEWRKLGLKVTLQVLPPTQQSSAVWMNRTKWDMTTWEMVGRPERSDPDELTYSLFYSGLADTGYDFVGYKNSEYDRLAKAQRAEEDRDKRVALVKQTQMLIKRDQPYVYLVYPRRSMAFNTEIWDPATIVEEAGIGIRNFWSFLQAKPLGAQKDMILNAPQPTSTLNPVHMDPIGSWVTDMIWDHLMRVDIHGNPVPWAAEQVRLTDPTTVEAVLRDGMKFHDGQPVTAEDVQYSFQMPAVKAKAPQFYPNVANIDSVTVTGPRTVQFKLKAPQAAFFTATLSKIAIIPKHVWKPIMDGLEGTSQTVEDYREQKCIGSGPFRFVHWRDPEEIMLERNPDHWSPPKLDRWILRTVSNQEATLGMLRNGEINFLAIFTGDPQNVAELAKQEPKIKVVTTTDLGFQYIALNLRRPPFDDTAFRVALSTAISRRIMAAAAWNGYAEPAGSCVSTALPFWHAEDSLLAGGDLAKSKQLLAAAGYTLAGGQLHYPAGRKEEITSG